ncbi:GGDEF domain-containing protein [Shewanella avicenniae]|uniref:diguanylate cyclase n=1 Tax=Shewanella avicenniae TaxID=2814294 RepID=A0ABX7QLJ3_9GAMM|nr:diguanylate cyclase [Shewanella avicenniae]QSX32328.1 GGDEF domain-containing protein [Shewanella avicenniae]
MVLRRFFILLLLLAVPLWPSAAAPLADSLITTIEHLEEDTSTPLSLLQAQQQFAQGNATTADYQFLTFGIKEHATWVKISTHNPSTRALRKRLTAAQTWVESVDVYLVKEQQILYHWHSGDGQMADNHLVPTLGYVFDMELPSGDSDIYIRAASLDPLVMPISLTNVYEARALQTKVHVSMGVLYGILMALVGFNLLLYATLKHSVALHYSLYIGCFLVMNFGYEGFAFSWLYPHSSSFQNYSTLFFMVLHGASGLLFVCSYLQIPLNKSRFRQWVTSYSILGLIASATTVVLQLHILTAWIAFGFISLTTLIMIVVALLNVAKSVDARYLLLAVSFSMLGLLASSLSVLGVIPYSFYAYHGAEFGVVSEAIILAIVVAFRLRNIEQERISAQYLATHDPLTRLSNRRAFEAAAREFLQQPANINKPVSFIMMDIDHFKAINDSYGHHVGDQALYHIATLMGYQYRKGDTMARWGGEEVAILLPNTQLAAAVRYAEQLRLSVQNSPLIAESQRIHITASFGVSFCVNHGQTEILHDLYIRADKWLYRAKNKGRNRVEPSVDEVNASVPLAIL